MINYPIYVDVYPNDCDCYESFVIQINNRKILSGFFSSLDLEDKITDILRIIDKIEKIGEDAVKEELSLLGVDSEKINSIMNFISIDGTNTEKIEKLKGLNISSSVFETGINELEDVINNLKALEVNEDNFEINLTIARGLDYYTGTVYETKLKDYPSLGSVCSGGRYENLAEYYTDKKLPGVGISIGLTRLFYQLNEEGLLKSESTSPSDIIILPMCENYNYIGKVASEIRKQNISVNVCYIEKGFKQKMKYANKLQTKYAIIIGEDEVNQNKIVLKNMIDGSQTDISINELSNIDKYFQ